MCAAELAVARSWSHRQPYVWTQLHVFFIVVQLAAMLHTWSTTPNDMFSAHSQLVETACFETHGSSFPLACSIFLRRLSTGLHLERSAPLSVFRLWCFCVAPQALGRFLCRYRCHSCKESMQSPDNLFIASRTGFHICT